MIKKSKPSAFVRMLLIGIVITSMIIITPSIGIADGSGGPPPPPQDVEQVNQDAGDISLIDLLLLIIL